jgi:heme-degrading monooxygenase HmoA
MMTIVSRVRLKVGSEPGWDAAFRERVEAAQQHEGWVAVQLCIPVEAANERVVIGTWQTRADWEAWHASEVFERTRDQMDAAEDGPREEWWHEVILDERR